MRTKGLYLEEKYYSINSFDFVSITLILFSFLKLFKMTLEYKVKMFKVVNGIFKNQCYLIYSDLEGVLIDPAWEFDKISDFLDQNNIVLKAILLTHSHLDHTDLAYEFSEKRKVPVFMSDKEINIWLFRSDRATYFGQMVPL
ncbi:MBL fold metallo-hydrolase [Aquimarina sp. RZ0]|uniref:MBL fold metallo-hydrolase n=1 Tax=Aquimarina sp. RZ0 TaxID=2607730 RepID=UPI0011F3AE3C|nr:MBL fold metallo-hydrolase [Aquimarina sp. RZ0]KAA1246080.1 MBL fold metallo-hydrolase [Aquimarina sp. RZ0]